MENIINDNVIILGAGASFDAKVPLLKDFVDTMWEFSVRGKNGVEPLSIEDKQIFANAIKVRDELDGYHGRANFDDRNLEDILSILSFNLMGGTRKDRERLKWITKAIARTIELECEVKHTGENKIIRQGDTIYQKFWKNLFSLFEDFKSIPTIISFNYDLVLERALFQLLNNTEYNMYQNPFPKGDGIMIDYQNSLIEKLIYKLEYCRYKDGTTIEGRQGTRLKFVGQTELSDVFKINLLKLHGSLNFDLKSKIKLDGNIPVNSLEEPFILPPIFNKLNSKSIEETWKTALQALRNSKNVLIVGYSLPKTDIYMNYFLKTALGPNVNLNKIYIFNPTLFDSNKENDLMRARYEDCFAPQLQNRIIFEPGATFDNRSGGTFKHFVHSINDKSKIFF